MKKLPFFKWDIYVCTLRTVTLVLLFATNSLLAQEWPVTLNVNNRPVQQVLDQIEEQSGLKFVLQNDNFNVQQRISYQARERDLNSVLNELSSELDFSFEISENKYILINPLVKEGEQQQRVVRGTVVDELNMPLAGVNVFIKSTSRGTITDIDGEYELRILPGDQLLMFSFVGYLNVEIPIGEQTKIDIALEPDVQSLSELVVIGYGTMKRTDVTSSISTIKGADLTIGANSNITQSLQGLTPGVNVTSTSSSPGGGVSVKIRGIGTINSNDPLYVIDGVPVQKSIPIGTSDYGGNIAPSGVIDFLSASDIESMEVLKDASAAAIYGSRGANGVILITTKKGGDHPMRVTFEGSSGFQEAAFLPEMANSVRYAETINRALENDGNAPRYTELDTLGTGTDWLNEITRRGLIHNYNLNFLGGNKTINYSSNLSYFNQEGIVEGSDYEKISARLATETRINKRLVFGNSIILAYTKRNVINEKNLYGGILTNALFIDPFTPVYRPQNEIETAFNEYSIYATSDVTNIGNPVGQIARNFDNRSDLNGIGNIYFTLDIMDGLVFKTNFGLDFREWKQDNYFPVYFIDPVEKNEVNQVNIGARTWFNSVLENTLTYTTSFNSAHSLTVLAGNTMEKNNYNFFGTSIQDIPGNDPALRYINMGTSNPTNWGDQSISSLMSYLFRVNYSYLQKYIITLSYRADGSSKFPEGKREDGFSLFTKQKRWGEFPSISGAWILNKEDFLDDLEMLSLLKLRAGWGMIGNQNIQDGGYLDLIANTRRYVFGNEIYPGYGPAQPGNADLRWETTRDVNIGLESGFLDNRISFIAEVYRRTTTDMLLEVPIASFTGLFSAPYGPGDGILTNAGDVRNEGIELALSYRNNHEKLSYEISGNMSFLRNEVLDLGGEDFIDAGNYRSLSGSITRTTVEQPIASFYGLVTDGIFQTQDEVEAHALDGQLIQPRAKPGDIRFRDLSGDGRINSLDRDFLGSPLPTMNYGLNFTVRYSNFDISLYMYGASGHKIFDGMKIFNNSGTGYYNVSSTILDEAWDAEGSTNEVARLTSTDPNSNLSRFSDYFLADGSFFRIKNLQVGYSIPIENKVTGINSLRIYVGSQNLFTLTDYTGLNPEFTNDNVLESGIDYSNYPAARTFLGGIKISF
ncbi:MAG: SusC/RagA family TonB-linked outer membrane protein [Bacteroidales bacterium]|nr:SusC/RagA family TonB-linked outer membrane protein [Bacteroidales bacterium]